MACNDAVESDATILNTSPYKQGWIVRIKPSDLAAEQGELVSGEEALNGFKAYMTEKELGECIHCEGFDG
jgi:glycine cleavage system H protein